MADESDTPSRQVLVKLVALLESVAHELRGGADVAAVAGILEQYAQMIRDDLHRGPVP